MGLAIVALALPVGCAPAVTIPADSAPPQLVLDVYLRALVAGDCGTAGRLTTAPFGRGNGDLCGATDVTGYRIEGAPAGFPDRELVFATDLVTTGTSDGSVPAGQTIWFFALTRRPDGPWRISGGGSGP